jgi:hypothetical protein
MSLDELSRALARPLPRRRALGLMGSALVGSALGLGPKLTRSQAGIVITVVGSGRSCAGCTEGGLACVGLNDCQAGCLEEEMRDCCGNPVTGPVRTCCPSCTNAPPQCKPNVPCRGKENSILSDSCPAVGTAPRGCQHYARRNECLKGKCQYYAVTAPKFCKDPPITTSTLTAEQQQCIRECLQVADSRLGPTDKTASGCTRVSAITAYHKRCFQFCGVSGMRFPDWWHWVEADDGD